jgi:hypothetical protein
MQLTAMRLPASLFSSYCRTEGGGEGGKQKKRKERKEREKKSKKQKKTFNTHAAYFSVSSC